jgi:conjugal transfer pilus assembly protein TraW
MYRAMLCAAWLALSCEGAALAKDLGVRGETFDIAERDLFTEIAEKFAAMEESGEVDAVNQRLRDRAIAAAHRPSPVQGLRPTSTPRTWAHDPGIMLAKDIVTPNGQMIGRAGQRFNPLDYTPFHQTLIFFDADDPDQLAWAETELARTDTLVQPVLVRGAVIDLMRDWKQPVWFDQRGDLIRRFGIKQVPARVSRQGDHLLIEEVTP